MKQGQSHHHDTDERHVSVFVLTVSDTRTPETDESGRTILEQLRGEGHEIAGYTIVKDEPDLVTKTIQTAISQTHLDAIVVNGGTGISERDNTFEAVDRLFEKTLPGFGEIFRSLSFEEIGTRAILSRAAAGLVKGKVVFLVPGSPNAVRLAMTKLITPLLGHAVAEAKNGIDGHTYDR